VTALKIQAVVPEDFYCANLQLVFYQRLQLESDSYHVLKWAVLLIEVGLVLKELMQAMHII